MKIVVPLTMDKSADYIVKCGKAKEIQELWKQDHGDFYVCENGRVTCWISTLDNPRKIKMGFGINTEDGIIRLSRYVWLPRLNQLIEMAQEKDKPFERTTQDFFDWTKTQYHHSTECPSRIFHSLEQLWLAFVMIRKFGKIWNGSAWVMGSSTIKKHTKIVHFPKAF